MATDTDWVSHNLIGQNLKGKRHSTIRTIFSIITGTIDCGRGDCSCFRLRIQIFDWFYFRDTFTPDIIIVNFETQLKIMYANIREKSVFVKAFAKW